MIGHSSTKSAPVLVSFSWAVEEPALCNELCSLTGVYSSVLHMDA